MDVRKNINNLAVKQWSKVSFYRFPVSKPFPEAIAVSIRGGGVGPATETAGKPTDSKT